MGPYHPIVKSSGVAADGAWLKRLLILASEALLMDCELLDTVLWLPPTFSGFSGKLIWRLACGSEFERMVAEQSSPKCESCRDVMSPVLLHRCDRGSLMQNWV